MHTVDVDSLLIFGGSFDPPHRGHTTLPHLVAREIDCDRLLYVPARVSPFKEGEAVTPGEDRLAMLWVALADVPEADISTIELDRPGPSYTIDTLEALRPLYGPACRFHLLIGTDQALSFQRWHQWQRILEICTPAVMIRPPETDGSFKARLAEHYDADEVDRWLSWTVPVPQIDVSSTEIRRRIACGEPTDELLHPEVAAYIDREGLYRKQKAETQNAE